MIITCENLVKIYKVADLEILALQGLEMTVQRGELLGIVGASGSGKTTLMNVLGGLLRPSAGRAIVDGNDLLKMSTSALDRYRRTKVGFVWQQGARNLIPYLNAVENVELPMTLAGQAKTRQRASELLELVGLGERMYHRLPQLSGGEQQRVAIAVALANSPSILLADEPTGELDSETALTIYRAFQQLNQELNLTTIIVSHDPGIARHVNRVVAIRDGKTSSETRRARPIKVEESVDETADLPEEQFEELTVLDSAGRLQVPKDYLEQLNIQGRVRMEMTDDGILITPVEGDEPLLVGQTERAETADSDEPPPAATGLRGWLGKIRGGRG